MTAEENLSPSQFTKSGKRRHRMVKFGDRSGVNIECAHCEKIVKHPTKTNKWGHPIDSWHYTDKKGMSEAWEAHKEQNQ
jgi:hypothetical protein